MTAAAPKLTIPIVGGTAEVSVEAGKTIFIVGRNGTGKSALVHQMLSMLGVWTGIQNRVIPGIGAVWPPAAR